MYAFFFYTLYLYTMFEVFLVDTFFRTRFISSYGEPRPCIEHRYFALKGLSNQQYNISCEKYVITILRTCIFSMITRVQSTSLSTPVYSQRCLVVWSSFALIVRKRMPAFFVSSNTNTWRRTFILVASSFESRGYDCVVEGEIVSTKVD